MKTAKEMFEELGYEKDSTCEINGHLYYFKESFKIDFDLHDKNIYKYNCLNNCKCSINMKELEAINKQVKELNWYENNSI